MIQQSEICPVCDTKIEMGVSLAECRETGFHFCSEKCRKTQLDLHKIKTGHDQNEFFKKQTTQAHESADSKIAEQKKSCFGISLLLEKAATFKKNFLFDIKYGAFLGGNKKTSYPELGAYDTVNTSYTILPQLFDGRVTKSDVLVDVGCGKGRVINWWLAQGYKNEIVGLELDSGVAQKVGYRLKKYDNVSIVAGDAIENLPLNGTLYYLYNPFNAEIMQKFSVRLKTLSKGKADIRLIYYNPEHISVFESDPNWKISELDVDLREQYAAPLLIQFVG